jgi:general secretion pathway protein A
MYLEHYGLAEAPFSITPDPRFVFLSERHRDALAHLLFGIGQGGGGGFVQLTGEVGTGKTTLSRLLLEQIPENTRVALVLNPRVSPLELLQTICEELHVETEGRRGSSKALVDALNAYLLDAYAQGLRVVLVIDEAQNLSVDALEQVRLLTNLETDTQKLLQIVLLGQPELRAMLTRDDLRQLAQRITARFHLTPLDPAETGEYLRHRYRIAGGQRFPFNTGAVRRLHARSGGVPRLLNVVAERALLAGYARDAQTIDERLVDAAADEALPSQPMARRLPWPWLAAAAGALVAVLALVALWPDPEAPLPTATAGAAIAEGTAADAVPAAAVPTAQPVRRLDADALAQVLAIAPASPQSAWQRLLELWEQPSSAITVDADGGCTAAGASVHCSGGSAPLDRLLALDRPVVLRLRNGTAPAWAVLVGADARSARLSLDDGVADIERGLLQSVWDGGYTALWLGPAALGTPMAPGSRGPAVDWLRARLALPAGNGASYDAATAEAVRDFQRARGLPVDGVAGPETQIALAGDEAGPRLKRELGEDR